MLSSFYFFRRLLKCIPERYSLHLGGGKGPEIKLVSKSLLGVNSRSAARAQNYLLLDSDVAIG